MCWSSAAAAAVGAVKMETRWVVAVVALRSTMSNPCIFPLETKQSLLALVAQAEMEP
jgi:hypothetical protein